MIFFKLNNVLKKFEIVIKKLEDFIYEIAIKTFN